MLGSRLGGGCFPSQLPKLLSLMLRDSLRLSSWGRERGLSARGAGPRPRSAGASGRARCSPAPPSAGLWAPRTSSSAPAPLRQPGASREAAGLCRAPSPWALAAPGQTGASPAASTQRRCWSGSPCARSCGPHPRQCVGQALGLGVPPCCRETGVGERPVQGSGSGAVLLTSRVTTRHGRPEPGTSADPGRAQQRGGTSVLRWDQEGEARMAQGQRCPGELGGLHVVCLLCVLPMGWGWRGGMGPQDVARHKAPGREAGRALRWGRREGSAWCPGEWERLRAVGMAGGKAGPPAFLPNTALACLQRGSAGPSLVPRLQSGVAHFAGPRRRSESAGGPRARRGEARSLSPFSPLLVAVLPSGSHPCSQGRQSPCAPTRTLPPAPLLLQLWPYRAQPTAPRRGAPPAASPCGCHALPWHSPSPARRTGSPPWPAAAQSTAPCARGRAASPPSPSACGSGSPLPTAGSAGEEGAGLAGIVGLPGPGLLAGCHRWYLPGDQVLQLVDVPLVLGVLLQV